MLRTSFFLALLCVSNVFLAQSPFSRTDITFITPDQRLVDATRQEMLRGAPAWQGYVASHPRWSVEFNEASGKPHRAFGPPVATVGATPEERALNFVSSELSRFGMPAAGLEHRVTVPTTKHSYVHFGQTHEGLPVIKGHLIVKLDQQGRVISFGTEVHDDIAVDVSPTIPASTAASVAAEGLANIVGTEINGLRILPVPGLYAMDHRLVHELIVETRDGDTPGRHLCWVDGHTGRLWYRQNQVTGKCGGHDDGTAGADLGADVQVNAAVYVSNPLAPTEVRGLPDLRVSINSTFYHTDADGFLPSGVTGPVAAQLQLRGLWSIVTTNNNTPTINTTLNEGSNTLSFDPNANIRERSAYHFVNNIHSHMKQWLPSFTGMDIALPTKIDLTSGDCNAFYDGSSINFYAEANNCRSLATMGDVVYHEYGHGINDKYYNSLGSNFSNGAMNEGYADVWALSLTLHPVLAQGWQLNNTNSYIRRYDQNPKVYPIDLVGQVHADGEIICGAWWDTYLLLGENIDQTMELFVGAYPGLQANAFNGQEGQAFRDVLIDALQADDDDADITNGSPNGAAIVEGFAMHGITLISSATLQHAPIMASPFAESIPIAANVELTFPFTQYVSGVRAFYRINAQSSWNSVLMTAQGGSNYVASLPAQEPGTVLAYYLAVEDLFGQLSAVSPVGAAQADPNLPYFIVVGCTLQATEDNDLVHQLGNWTTGLPTDNATTGQWEQNVPVPSYSDDGSMVQPGIQNTPGGEFCWVTGNANSPTSGMGENDVDGGTTTLASGNINLTGYVDPVFTYYRWYTNNPPGGANPNADWWQVYVSGNGGSTWVPVENSKTSDRSWRRMAFRVQDYVVPSANFRIKFHASDSVRPGQNLDGGSLVEAAVDDVQLWDRMAGGLEISEVKPAALASVFPDPASDVLNIVLEVNNAPDLRMEVIDLSGRMVLRPVVPGGLGSGARAIDVRSLSDGQYVLRLVWQGGQTQRKFTVLR